MNGLPPALQAAVTAQLHALGDSTDLQAARMLGGGMINHAAQLRTAGGQYLLKWNSSRPGQGLLAGEPLPQTWPQLFEAEAAGLRLLAATYTVRVPAVLAVGPALEHNAPDCPPFILLEWLTGAPETPAALYTLGQQLAELHRQGAAAQFGLDSDNYLGSVLQRNHWHNDWVTFYIDERLRPQMALARRLGRLPAVRARRLERIIERLPALLGGCEQRPCLIHGDLWAGNIIPGPAGLALIDPAVSYAEREMEIAYTELFGSFSAEFYAGYQAAWPLDPGYADRCDLYKLYHLINHLNHFGESYGPHVDAVLQAYS